MGWQGGIRQRRSPAPWRQLAVGTPGRLWKRVWELIVLVQAGGGMAASHSASASTAPDF